MCRYLNALSTESYVRANIRFIKITNIITATYVELLFTILNAVEKKKRFDLETGFFKVDRAFIFEKLNLEKVEQYNCDNMLEKLGIITINKDNKDKIRVDSAVYYKYVLDTELNPTEILPPTVKMTYVDRQVAKVAAIKARLVGLFGETNPEALKAITDLVEVYYSKGMVKNEQWLAVIPQFKEVAPNPKSVVKLVQFALLTNWQGLGFAIDKFKQDSQPSGGKLNTVQKKATTLLPGVEF